MNKIIRNNKQNYWSKSHSDYAESKFDIIQSHTIKTQLNQRFKRYQQMGSYLKSLKAGNEVGNSLGEMEIKDLAHYFIYIVQDCNSPFWLIIGPTDAPSTARNMHSVNEIQVSIYSVWKSHWTFSLQKNK